MADTDIIDGELLLVEIEDPVNPGILAHPCGVNAQRSVSFTANLTETEVRDCADPGKAAKIVRKVKSTDFQVTGAGKNQATDTLKFIQWQQAGLALNAKIVQNVAGSAGGFTGTGKLIISAYELTGEPGDYQENTITFVPAAPFTWAPNA